MSKMRTPLALLLAVGLSLLVVGGAWAQQSRQSKGPGDISAEIAKAKADFYARFATLASDPTPNQDKYDALYYSLDIDIDPSTDTVSGTVRMVAEVVDGPLSTVDVDLYTNMTVDSVVNASGTLAHSHSSDVLTVTLDGSYTNGSTFFFDIAYSGTPSASAGAFEFDMYGGEDMISYLVALQGLLT